MTPRVSRGGAGAAMGFINPFEQQITVIARVRVPSSLPFIIDVDRTCLTMEEI